MKTIKIACKGAGTLSLGQLTPLQGNLKVLTPDNLRRLKSELLSHGFIEPVAIWEDPESGKTFILNGHQRVTALNDLKNDGYKIPQIPVTWVEAGDLTDAKRKILALASQYGSVSTVGLGDFMADIGMDIPELNEHFNFPEIDLSALLAAEDVADMFIDGGEFNPILKKPEPVIESVFNTDPDAVPEVPKTANTKLGDIYVLGTHRLMCGDSTNVEHVKRLMNGEKADMVFTDPPYGVSYEQGKFTGVKPKKQFSKIANDELRGDDLNKFLASVWQNVHEVTEVCTIYSWSPPLLPGAEVLKSLVDSGFHIQSQIIWDKKRLVLGRADYQWRHEICWYGYKGTNHFWCGDRDQTSVWEQKRDSNYEHPTQKPVELAERAILNSCKDAGSVLDVFGGSGSTLIACEKTKRHGFLMELDPLYCDVIVQRWEAFTGAKADKASVVKLKKKI